MIFGCSLEKWHLGSLLGIIKSQDCLGILERNVLPSVAIATGY